MTDLLDLMAPSPKPTWRNGVAIPFGTRPEPFHADGDLQWFAHDYRDHRKGGRWFRYEMRDRIYRCLDPYDQFGINAHPDHPPELDKFGRMAVEGQVA